MKKQLINEAFRLQQLAGIQPINSLNEESRDEPKSKLDRIVQQAWQEDDINKAKNLVANYISNSKINNDSKKTILNKMKVITDKEKLDYYLANSLLKFEKMGLKEESEEGYSYYYDFKGNESNASKVMGNAKPNEGIKMQSITLSDGISYKIGDEEPEESGKIIYILKYPNGYEVASVSGFDEEEYQTMGLEEGTQIKLNGKPVDQSSLEIDGADSSDYPDFSDAYFSAGNYEDGTPLTDDELDQLGNDYPEVVNEMAFESFID
jgi:hypothetical protein